MVNFYPYKLAFWAWLLLLFRRRTLYIAVQMDAVGNPQYINIVPRKPKGTTPLTPEAQLEQSKKFEEARKQLTKKQEEAAASGRFNRRDRRNEQRKNHRH
jgi:hypothetical protein